MMIPLIACPPVPGMNGWWPEWVTPGDTRSEEDSVNTAVMGLDADIRASMVPLLFKTQWESFRAEWAAFYADQGGIGGWLDRFATGRAYSKTQDYRKQLDAWRGKYMQVGGSTSGPGLVPPPDDGNPTDALRYVAIIAVALGAVYVASKTGILSGLTSAPRTNPRRRRRRR